MKIVSRRSLSHILRDLSYKQKRTECGRSRHTGGEGHATHLSHACLSQGSSWQVTVTACGMVPGSHPARGVSSLQLLNLGRGFSSLHLLTEVLSPSTLRLVGFIITVFTIVSWQLVLYAVGFWTPIKPLL